LVDALTSYRMMLKLFNINDSQVALFKRNVFVQIVLMCYSFIRLLFSLIFVLPGNLMTLPLSTAINLYTEHQRIKALKASTVKVRANDVRSSIKILAYISTYPIYLCGFTLIFRAVLRWYYGVESAESWYYSLIFFLIYPILSIVSIRSYDGVRTHYTEFQGRMLSLFYVGQVELIKTTRKVLKKKVRKVVDSFGPKVYKNFDKMRIIMFDPSASQDGDNLKKTLKKSSSVKGLQKQDPFETRKKSMDVRIASVNNMKNKGEIGSNDSFEMPKTIYSDVDLSYMDELELNRAFSVFKNI
jgi:glycerol-3-phosphate O-acyltransferase/dihydroxyacetone phosphate acyltransferase